MKPKIFVTQPPAALKKFFCDSAIDKLQSFANIILNEKEKILDENELSQSIKDVEGVITGWEGSILTKNNIEQAKNLKIIAHLGASVKKIEPEFAMSKGITVINAAPACAHSVAEFTVGLILCSLHNIANHHAEIMQKKENWDDGPALHRDLRHKKVGLVGVGFIGTRVVDLLKPFKAEVIAYDPYLPEEKAKKLGLKLVSLKELMSTAQIISIHAGLTKETRHLISRDMLNLIQNGALLVNTARGAIIDEKALIEIAKKKNIKIALEVFEDEPIPLDSELRNLSNAVLTPHVANLNEDTYKWVGLTVAEDLERFFSGKKPKNVVLKEKLPLMT